MASTIPISVAIYDNPGIMHWSLYIEAENTDDRAIIQVLGARQKYFPNMRALSNPDSFGSLIDLLHLCQIDASKLEILKEIACATPIRNDLADWSCQDYVLDILHRLEQASIIDAADDEYIMKRQAVAAKRESWA